MSADEAGFAGALAGLLSGSPLLLDGFGLERICDAAPAWVERLTIEGPGTVTLSTVRSIMDASGEEIGRFEGSASREEVRALAEALAALVSTPAQPARIEPGDMHIVLRAVVGGATWERVLLSEPTVLAPWKPLLALLDRLAVAGRSRPVATLGVGLTLGQPLKPGSQELSLSLFFKNRGRIGYWMTNPSARLADSDDEHCRLVLAPEPVLDPNLTPLPPELQTVALRPLVVAERPLLWLPAGATEERPFSAPVTVERGPHLLRASFASYSFTGAGGRPALRGCAFSDEQRVVVG